RRRERGLGIAAEIGRPRVGIAWPCAASEAASAEPPLLEYPPTLGVGAEFGANRLGDVLVIGDRAPVTHQHDEGLEHVAVVLVDVLLEIEARVIGKRRA